MQRNRPPSTQAVSILRALAADPARWRYGYDLATEVHLPRIASVSLHISDDPRQHVLYVVRLIREVKRRQGCSSPRP